jgi:hypothetical protein
MSRYAFLAIALLMPAAGATAASRASPAQSGLLDSVLACRSIADSAQRLACFDARVGDLQSASARHDVMVVDRDEVRKERRSLFGFNIADLKILGGGNDAKSPVEEEDKEITAVVRSARTDGDGNWIVTLEDGAVWHQTDGAPMGRTPKAGVSVTIRRGALGAYFMKVANGSSCKVRREG